MTGVPVGSNAFAIAPQSLMKVRLDLRSIPISPRLGPLRGTKRILKVRKD